MSDLELVAILVAIVSKDIF